MNNELTTLKKIFKICKDTENFENEMIVNSVDKPVLEDIILSKRAMAYEEILEIMKKFAKTQKK